jgi:hypothetical protein
VIHIRYINLNQSEHVPSGQHPAAHQMSAPFLVDVIGRCVLAVNNDVEPANHDNPIRKLSPPNPPQNTGLISGSFLLKFWGLKGTIDIYYTVRQPKKGWQEIYNVRIIPLHYPLHSSVPGVVGSEGPHVEIGFLSPFIHTLHLSPFYLTAIICTVNRGRGGNSTIVPPSSRPVQGKRLEAVSTLLAPSSLECCQWAASHQHPRFVSFLPRSHFIPLSHCIDTLISTLFRTLRLGITFPFHILKSTLRLPDHRPSHRTSHRAYNPSSLPALMWLYQS